MNYQPQTFQTPDGTEMVILPAADFARLMALADDREDLVDVTAILARIDAGEGIMPGDVLTAVLEEGLTPLAAWRRYRGMTQVELAKRAGFSQVWVGRIEAGGGYGSLKTRKALAAALDAPLWGLDHDFEA